MGRNEADLRRVLDTVFTFVGMLTPDGTLVEVNQAALAAAGIAGSDVIGKKLWDCYWWNFSAESQARVREAIVRASQGENPRFDVAIRIAGDTRKWVDFQLAPLRDVSNSVTHLIPSAIDITERKAVEERLRASEARLQRAGRAARVGVWEWNPDTGSAYWSREAAQLYGYPPDCIATFERWLASIHPEDRERAMQVIKSAVDAARRSPETTTYCDEYRVQHRDGTILWVESEGAFVKESGHLLAMGVARDVTDRKQAERALRDSEERLRFIAERGDVGYWHWDISRQRLEWSPLCRKLFGVPQDASVSYESFIHAVHPKDRARTEAAVRACLDSSGREDYDTQFRAQWPDGTTRWIHAKGSATFAHGVPVRMAGIALDITDRKRAEGIFAEQSALLETLMSKAPVGLAFVDKDCRYVRVNEMLAAMNGVSANKHVGRTVSEIVPAVWKKVEKLYREALSGQAVANVEMTAETAATNGDSRHWLVSYYPVRVGGAVRGVGTVVVDITTQKATEALLKEADRRKDEFLATLSHELRNPLAPIRNAVNILQLYAPGGKEFQTAQDIIQRQLRQMVRLIDDLLDVSRISRGKLALRREPVTLNTVLEQALEASRPHIDRRGHKLIVSMPSDPIYIDADNLRLAQVFSNLLNNASKFTRKGGEIALEISRNETSVAVTVKDSGIGIAPEHLGLIFEIFAQVGPNPEQPQEGLGIGLSLSKALVELHHGTIEARSDGPGTGAEFIVRLPVLRRDIRGGSDRREAMHQQVQRHRVVVADDNRDSAESLAMLLRSMGSEVETVFDGAEAIRKVEQYQPDLVLLDLRMPHVSGYDACRAMRRSSWGKDLVIVAVSGCGDEKDRLESHDAGFNAHLVKPLDDAGIVSLLNFSFTSWGSAAPTAQPPLTSPPPTAESGLL